MSHKVLIVDDERNIRRTFGMVLRGEGFSVLEAESGERALEVLEKDAVELVILDIRLPGMDGIATLREIKRADPEQVVVMISGHGTIATAVEATREGAFDFLEKPCSKERVLLAVQNGLRFASLGREVRALRDRDRDRYEMVGESAPLAEIREQIDQVGPTGARVLISGDSGTGKELVARAVHGASDRRDGPFVKVNCAAIPEELIESELFGAAKGSYTGATESRDGRFLQAHTGTLLLDEVGDMSLKAQAKVLRALQEGEIEKVGGTEPIVVDVRVLAATNKDLPAEVARGRFREDLYFRLNVVPIRVPSLAQRSEDIPILAEHFLRRYSRDNNLPGRTFAPEVLKVLAQLPWPGNVRELHNVVERLAIMSRGNTIQLEDLRRTGVLSPDTAAPSAGRPAAAGERPVSLSSGDILRLGGLVQARRSFEAACIRNCLAETGGNVSQASRLLGIDRTNLHKKIQSFGLNTETDGPESGGS